MSVQNNLANIQENIQKACEKSNRNPEDVQIIAVTKYVTVDRAQEAIKAGVSHLGENRAEGFQEKYTAIGDQVHWHFIGTLQSRKVKEIVHQVDFIHSLDRKSLAKEINKRAEKPISCFVQVNVSGESSKHGLEPDEVSDFIQSLKDYPKINIVGLMTMAPHTDEEEVIRNCFRSLRQIQLEIQQLSLDFAPCQYLSMGMSNDYQIAIEEGATHIRIGSSLVGEE
ncbi:YggS family pyridoxal phosphate-dependent enzyme [Allobacillus sp. SKP2-8]|uniref:YggS family pyridoxal phosphate-dependent enzyme n=1 Tax=unclassified Allobacillus TaxID=2628859 RepID=UPI0011837AFA|nr:YggS family pyridoxal phosphate-dependent enzyme [Allobacillus sp. SKP2-8]TSJ69299.1 YggS family pyridoxal phosphate-dependent enzyme [Allobacillus sp. SKP2-8]